MAVRAHPVTCAEEAAVFEDRGALGMSGEEEYPGTGGRDVRGVKGEADLADAAAGFPVGARRGCRGGWGLAAAGEVPIVGRQWEAVSSMFTSPSRLGLTLLSRAQVKL